MKKLIVGYLLITFISACDLTEVVNIEPPNALTEESAIKDAETAELALAGTYEYLQGIELTLFQPIIPSVMGIEAQPLPFGGLDLTGYFTNAPDPANDFLTQYYSGIYHLINRANFIIANVPNLPDEQFEGNRKNEIVAEARFLRGLFHFYLLRQFGQFYNTGSELGIVLRREPARENKYLPRSSVQETFNLITEDLEYAIDQLPADQASIYASRFAAMGRGFTPLEGPETRQRPKGGSVF